MICAATGSRPAPAFCATSPRNSSRCRCGEIGLLPKFAVCSSLWWPINVAGVRLRSFLAHCCELVKQFPASSLEGEPPVTTPRFVRPLLLAIGFAVLFAQLGGNAQVTPVSLPFADDYLVTGNYFVGFVDLPSTGGGSATGTINVDANLDNAEVLAAYLYWETIVSQPSQLSGVMFRGQPIELNNVEVVKTAPQTLTENTAACFSSGGGQGAIYTMYSMRADVRRLLPRQFDANGKPTGKRLVSVSDLATNNDPLTNKPYLPHTVTLPESLSGNIVPQSAGGALVVIVRDPTQPLRKIVVYDNTAWGTASPSFIIPNVAGATLSQKIRGIYQSSSTKYFKTTIIGGSGQPNGHERVFVNGTLVGGNTSFPGSSSASDRSWAAPTFDSQSFPNAMPGATTNDGYGETATVAVDHTTPNPYDCVAAGAVIFSTEVKDVDLDGIPDGIEDAVGGLDKDANGDLLPNLS